MLGLGPSKEVRRVAALHIQCAYRCHLARDRVYAAYRAQNVKYYSADEDAFFYRNKVRLYVDEFRPRFLREDLPTPRKNGERAPEEYNAGVEDTSSGYLVLVTSNYFHIGKWAELPSADALGADHEALRGLFSHEFIGKFRPENVAMLKNPSTVEFKEAMEMMRRKVKAGGFLTLVMATQVVTVLKGEKGSREKGREKAYFAFANSVWGSNEEIAESCISLSSLVTMLNRISCKTKTVILNYAHTPKTRAVLFPSSKQFYPPQGLLSQLCERASCVVIGP
eukprot:CAMPEP_0173332554 /NCGR_PEP_ID=MMETSP1144-20121109/4415_1 /TAXON_ID=483371 /ORGANISM="non described non described, Strain CCMP2298" /LENGTH=279 /DNA_ID=CAMNT_0014277447 /DNA_START=107 /DNA_END=942 /DNA_ORIENTATION=+